MKALYAVVLVALTVLAAGCNSGIGGDRADARKGGSVLVGLPSGPDSLDPAVARSPEALQALWLAYTPPLTYRRAGGARGTEIVPGLAERMPEASAGDTTFRFTFRKGLHYPDGRPLLAGDFERAIGRARALNPPARRELSGVEDIVADERTRTVRIELAAPDPAFPRLLASTWATPVGPGPPARDISSSPPAGIGPYRLKGSSRGRAYVLSRRRDFRLANVPAGNVDSIAGVVVRDSSRRTNQTLRGRLDLTQGEPPTSRLPEIRSEDKRRYREFPTLSERFVSFDLARRPFRDQDLRRAVSFALDLQTLVRLEEGFLSPSCNLIPPQVPGYARLDPCPYGPREGDADLVRAEQLVRGSRDRKVEVIVDGGPGPRSEALARYGVGTLRKIGLRARRARTERDSSRAQLRFAEVRPALPGPAGYIGAVDDAGIRSDAGATQRDGTVAETVARWADLDKRVVGGGLVAPYGVATTGVLLSERLDAANCLRFHPVYGADLSALCLR
ncbi:MAG: ABC transporter substrate-binding protein [Thermoleophilaceae bacterium]